MEKNARNYLCKYICGSMSITGIHLDEDGDICLESDQRSLHVMSPKEIAYAVSSYDGNKKVYFVSIDVNGESELYNIKDGGTKDRLDANLQIIRSKEFLQCLGQYSQDVILHFESGTINFTVNSVYPDEYGGSTHILTFLHNKEFRSRYSLAKCSISYISSCI